MSFQSWSESPFGVVHKGLPKGMKRLRLKTEPSEYGGHLTTARRRKKDLGVLWTKDSGEIEFIGVSDRHRRKGLGTAMMHHAQRNGIKVQHSAKRTDDGEIWARGVGGKLPKRNMNYAGD